MSSTISSHADSFPGSGEPGDHNECLLLAELCDEFTQRKRAGENPSVEEYAASYPQLAEQIGTAFPALIMFGDLGDSINNSEEDGPDPTEVAGYQIVRRVGTGGMGVVYEATHPTVSRRVAIKVLKPKKGNAEKFQDRFLREAEAASRLNHPNIVPFLDCGNDGDVAYLAMHFVDGQSLDHMLEEGCEQNAAVGDGIKSSPAGTLIGRDFQQIAKLGADVAGALQQAHSLGTIHRDIKPANLILDQAGKIWVTDFGLAKLRDEESDLSRTGDLIGTPRYMAPEQIRGLADDRSDIYALGVTLYELASGHRAWGSTKQSDLLGVRSAFELPEIAELHPRVPESLASIIMKACAHDPDHRYQSAGDLERDLNQFAHGKAVSDRRVRRDAVPPLSLLRPQYILAGIAGIFLAGMLFQSDPSTLENVVVDSRAKYGNSDVIAGKSQRFEVREGGSMSRTVMPTMNKHAGLVMWWVSGGEDANYFKINRSNGLLEPREPFTHSKPKDAEGNSVYRVRVGMKSISMTEEADVEFVVKSR